MAPAQMATREVHVDDVLRSEAVEFVEEARDRVAGDVLIALDDGSQARLPAGLSRFVLSMIESVASGAGLSTSSLPEELTTTVAAEVLGVSRPTLMKMVGRGELEGKRVGTHTRLRREDVMRLRAERQAARQRAVEDLRIAGEAFETDPTR